MPTPGRQDRRQSPRRGRCPSVLKQPTVLARMDPLRTDFIVSSSFTHHLEDADLVRFIPWMGRYAAHGWFIRTCSVTSCTCWLKPASRQGGRASNGSFPLATACHADKRSKLTCGSCASPSLSSISWMESPLLRSARGDCSQPDSTFGSCCEAVWSAPP